LNIPCTFLLIWISILFLKVNKIRDQCQKQEETINEQEGELNAKRSELQKLKDEESSLQKEYDDNNKELSKLTKHLQNTQLQISSVCNLYLFPPLIYIWYLTCVF